MAATPATVEAYLTAAQAAFASSDYTEAKKQIILGQMELDKLPSSDGLDGESTQFRASFDRILTQIETFAKIAGRTSRRSIAREV